MDAIHHAAQADHAAPIDAQSSRTGAITLAAHAQHIDPSTANAASEVVPNRTLGVYAFGCQQRAARIETEVRDALGEDPPRYDELCYRLLQATRDAKNNETMAILNRDAAYAVMAFAFVQFTFSRTGRAVGGIGLSAIGGVVSAPHASNVEQFSRIRDDCRTALILKFGLPFVQPLSKLPLNADGLREAIRMLREYAVEDGGTLDLSVIEEKLNEWDPGREPPKVLDWLARLVDKIHPNRRPIDPFQRSS